MSATTLTVEAKKPNPRVVPRRRFTALELFDDARIIATVDAAGRVIELSDRSKRANLAV